MRPVIRTSLAIVIAILANFLWCALALSLVIPVIVSLTAPRLVAVVAGRRYLLWGLFTNLLWLPLYLYGVAAYSGRGWAPDPGSQALLKQQRIEELLFALGAAAWQSLAAVVVCISLHRRERRSNERRASVVGDLSNSGDE